VLNEAPTTFLSATSTFFPFSPRRLKDRESVLSSPKRSLPQCDPDLFSSRFFLPFVSSPRPIRRMPHLSSSAESVASAPLRFVLSSYLLALSAPPLNRGLLFLTSKGPLFNQGSSNLLTPRVSLRNRGHRAILSSQARDPLFRGVRSSFSSPRLRFSGIIEVIATSPRFFFLPPVTTRRRAFFFSALPPPFLR